MIQKIREHPLTRIISGTIICGLVPVIIKIGILRPVFGLLRINEQISKGIQGIIMIGIILGVYRMFYHWMENREVAEIRGAHFLVDSFRGLGIGFALITVVTGILYISGYYVPTGLNPVIGLLKPIVIFSVMGVWEEIIFRGIIYRITEESWGTVRALMVSSLVFGFIHFHNSGFTWFSGMAIVFELGLLTGITYTITQRLWMPIALHIGWNLSFVFYGLTVSGADEYGRFIESRLVGPELLTGGTFGPENSILTILFSMALFAFLYQSAAKQGRLHTLPGRKTI
ncbi:MAG: CPBP family intramembrane metalloprotease [FCB group bacterium]|nr:CPBP family intramembrane metalloprotease [FCB group bacterium]